VFSGADEGNLSYILKHAEALGVREQVDYRGRVSDEALLALYRGALALVFASAVAPDNLQPLEAMALGCPVIAADVPGAREQYGDAALFLSHGVGRGVGRTDIFPSERRGVAQGTDRARTFPRRAVHGGELRQPHDRYLRRLFRRRARLQHTTFSGHEKLRMNQPRFSMFSHVADPLHTLLARGTLSKHGTPSQADRGPIKLCRSR